MKVLLVNIDETSYPNLALKKIEKYHLDRGDEVSWDYMPLFFKQYDKIYASCIFTKNRYKCEKLEDLPNVIIGGTGYDIAKKLPTEIEDVKPRINYGFTSRGCIRNCSFCLVKKKEGDIHAVGDIYDIWDGKSKQIILMDNNILALPDHFKMICEQLKKEKLKVDFNQGLDVRLLNEHNAKLLKSVRHKNDYRFSWDLDQDLTDKFKYAKEKVGRCFVYVYVGENSDEKFLLWKLHTLRNMGHRAFLMRDEKVRKKYELLAKWTHAFGCFAKMTFEEYKKYYKFCNSRYQSIGTQGGLFNNI